MKTIRTITALFVWLMTGFGVFAQNETGTPAKGLPLLQEGKEWNYDYSYVDIHFQRNNGSARFWIDGDTIVDGQRLFWMCFSNSEQEGQVFRQLWCEKEGKVFTCNEKGLTLDLVYDFTLSAGDNAPDHTTSAFFPDGFKVVSTDSILVHGVLRKRLILENPQWGSDNNIKVVWVEGIGGAKGLDEPIMHMVGDGRQYTLSSCYVNGICIFEKEDFAKPAFDDIEFVEMDLTTAERNDTGTIHDLQGRRMNGAPHKGIYIKNGRKYVVR